MDSHSFSCSFGCCSKDLNLVACIMSLESLRLLRSTIPASCSIFSMGVDLIAPVIILSAWF